MKLSRISLAILPLLSLSSVQAAVYNVVEIGEVPQVTSTYAAAINDNGDTVFNGAIQVSSTNAATGRPQTLFQYYKYPINLAAIDFEDENVQALFTDEQLSNAVNGNLDADILNILLYSNPSGQPIGFSLGYVLQGTEQAQNIVLRDTALTRTNSEYLYDINDNGIAVGLATTPFSWQSFTPAATEAVPEPETEQLWVPELSHQLGMAVISGTVTTLLPPYQQYGGGYSVATAVSADGRIAGYGSVELVAEAIATLDNVCTGESSPVNNCFYNYHTSSTTSPGALSQELTSFGYTQRGLLWQVSGADVSEPTILGFLGDKNSQAAHSLEGFKAINYYSKAYDVNVSGIAVGVSLYSDSDIALSSNQIFRTEHATLFNGTDATPMLDVKEWLRSSAVAINNNDIAVGNAFKVINSATRSKLFYFDYNTNQSVEVTGFFNSSNTAPNAINDSNQVVGRGEVIIGGTTTRRNHGFIYDINTDSFRDLNSLLSCESPYTIVDAQDINNNGVIVATALVKKAQRDVFGDEILDSSGNPQMADVAVTVKLEPIANGEIDNCSTEQTDYERKGGSTGVGMLTLASILLWWRRRQA
jgi:hypothetical protein